MSAKYFCDNCGKALDDHEHGRIRRRLGKITVEIMRAIDNCWNSGNVCFACIIKAANKGEDA